MISSLDTQSTLDRTVPPPIKDAIEFDLFLQPYKKSFLSNGVPVYYINDGAEEVAMIELVFNAGNYYENKNLVASAANQLLKNGTKSKSAFEINEHFEYYGAYLNRSCHHETAAITLHCLSRHLSELLPVIREILTESVFPEKELDIFKQNSIQRLLVNLKKSDFVAARLIDEYLYGADHPYGRISSVEAIRAITRHDLVNFFSNYYLKSSCRIFAAGKLPDDFENIVNTHFGDLALNESILPGAFKVQPAEEKKYRISNDPNGVQGSVRIARPFFNKHHPDFKKAFILNSVLGGYFGSRLMSNIREEKGYTYGIHSYIQNHIHECAWVITTEAGRDVCEATVEEVYKEMKILREQLIDEEELLLVKNYMMGLNLGDLDGPFQVIARWKNLILSGLDEMYFYDSINTIKSVTAAELQEIANKYLIPEDFFELVVI
ncbi:MAG TPA: pitrilysin family protein [Chitinophagaceae bacterium]|nr:pitrilysin family protein [Chitinophagaceae bacterium]